MNFNTEQRNAIFGEEPLIVVAAGAGSGKTRVLTERYVHLCELKLQSQLGYDANGKMGAEASEIVTLTFTEDAALEMKSRIRKRLLEKLHHAETEYLGHPDMASMYWKKQIESLDTAIISTFHSFCQRIVQENSLEANIYPNVQVLDDVGSKLLKAEIYAELVEEAEQTQKWHALLNHVKWSLQDSLFSVYGKIKEYEMIGSMKETLNVEGLIASWQPRIDEFEAAFYHFFQEHPDYSHLTPSNRKVFNNLKVIFLKGLSGEAFINCIKTELASVIKNKVPVSYLKSPEFYALLKNWFDLRELLLYQEEESDLVENALEDFEEFLLTFDEVYEQRKRESAVLDFSDLQQKAIVLMNDSGIQTYYSSLFKHFLVDEMQDTNQLQLRMIEKINPAYRFIVGDGKQSIYRFRGADVQIFNGLIHEAKENPRYSYIDMNTNYRTCNSIIRFINLLFEQPELMGATSDEAMPPYKTDYSPMTASRDEAREMDGKVEYIKVSPEQDQTRTESQYVMIARRMVQLMKERTEVYDKDDHVWRPVEWRDMAVLIASRTNLTILEQALKAYDIPYNVYGGLGFYERQEVVDYLSLLQWLNKPYEPLYMMAVLRGPLFGVTMEEFFEIHHAMDEKVNIADFIYGRGFRELESVELQTKLENFCSLLEKWAPFHWSLNNRGQLLQLFEDTGLKKVLLLQKNNLMKLKNVEKLIETIAGLQAVSMDEMLGKIAILADLSKKEGDAEVELSGGNFVHIMTVHGSKGLEFPVVFVPNLSKGMQYDTLSVRYDVKEGMALKFKVEDENNLLADPKDFCTPNIKSISTLSGAQAVEESKRLYYVALTRARDLLFLTSADDGKKNTWFWWLEEALKNSVELEDYVVIKEGVAEQKVIEDFKEVYEGPKVKLERTIPISFSVSEVMSYLNDPDGFLEKHLLKLDEIWREDADEIIIDEKLELEAFVDPRTLGTLVHRICELLDKGYSEAEAYQEAFSGIDEKGAYLGEVRPLIHSYQTKEFGEPLENEWEFVFDIDGVQVIGEIDKVIRKEGRLEVLDLKTNRIKDNVDELVNYYRPQLYLYKMAYEVAKQVTVDKMSLVFLRDKGQGVYEVAYDSTYEQRLLDVIREMAVLKREVLASG